MLKKIIYFSIALTSILLQSCLSSEESYQEACRKGNFEKAYSIADKVKSDEWFAGSYADKKARDKAYLYVASQEVIYLLSTNNYERIIYLYMQLKTTLEDKHRVAEFMKLVINKAVLDDKYDFLLKFLKLTGYSISDSNKLTNYLIGKQHTAANQLVLETLISYDPSPTRSDYHILPPLGEQRDYRVYEYCEYASTYNKNCYDYFQIAVQYGNKELAKQIVPLFKKDLDHEFITSAFRYVNKYLISEEEKQAKATLSKWK